MAKRTKSTDKEIAAIKLKNGNFVIFHDENNTRTSSYVKHDIGTPTYKGERIIGFYHTHPDRGNDPENPLDISEADIKTANKLKVQKIIIVYPDGRKFWVYKNLLNMPY